MEKCRDTKILLKKVKRFGQKMEIIKAGMKKVKIDGGNSGLKKK